MRVRMQCLLEMYNIKLVDHGTQIYKVDVLVTYECVCYTCFLEMYNIRLVDYGTPDLQVQSHIWVP